MNSQNYTEEGNLKVHNIKITVIICKFVFRLKDVAQQQYTHSEAENGAGKTKEILPPLHSKRIVPV